MSAPTTGRSHSSAGELEAPRYELSEAAKTELLSFPAQLLAGLPLRSRFVLHGLGSAWEIIFDSDPNPAQRDGIVFDAEEVRALAIGVEAERLWPADLKGFCLRKLQDSSFRVSEALVLAGAQPCAGRPWTLGRMLECLDLVLVGIEIATTAAPPAASAAAA